jgi:hypothetical protein
MEMQFCFDVITKPMHSLGKLMPTFARIDVQTQFMANYG